MPLCHNYAARMKNAKSNPTYPEDDNTLSHSMAVTTHSQGIIADITLDFYAFLIINPYIYHAEHFLNIMNISSTDI